MFLLIEVADSTLVYGREEKLPVYGRAGLPEVWIVNLNEAVLEIYRDPHFPVTWRPGPPHAFPDTVASVAELFKR